MRSLGTFHWRGELEWAAGLVTEDPLEPVGKGPSRPGTELVVPLPLARLPEDVGGYIL